VGIYLSSEVIPSKVSIPDEEVLISLFPGKKYIMLQHVYNKMYSLFGCTNNSLPIKTSRGGGKGYTKIFYSQKASRQIGRDMATRHFFSV
jgi:hypothetical protein